MIRNTSRFPKMKRTPDNVRYLGQFGEHILTRRFTACVESPGGISPRALPEPCMTLSSHTAPDVRPMLERLCPVHRLLLFPVGQWPRPNNAAPSLQPHYRAFDATTGCSAPAPRFGTLALA